MTADQKKEQFITAYSQYSDDIFRYLIFRVYNRDTARDLTQEVFTRTWKYIAQGKKIDNIRAFVYKVAYHLVIDCSKKKKEISLDQLMEGGFNVPDNVSVDQQMFLDSIAALQEIGRLDKDFQEVIMLRHVEDLSVKGISKLLDISESLVSVRIHRGLKQLESNIKK